MGERRACYPSNFITSAMQPVAKTKNRTHGHTGRMRPASPNRPSVTNPVLIPPNVSRVAII
jgi:hypothetical protein